MLRDTLYAKYIKNRQGLEILEGSHGFLTYKTDKDECFLADIFVEENMEGKIEAKHLFARLEEIARNKSCSHISANIHVSDKRASKTLQTALRYGFEVFGAEAGVLLIIKKRRM